MGAARAYSLPPADDLLGLVFLGIKGTEYVHKFEEHLVPGIRFVYEGPLTPVRCNCSFSSTSG